MNNMPFSDHCGTGSAAAATQQQALQRALVDEIAATLAAINLRTNGAVPAVHHGPPLPPVDADRETLMSRLANLCAAVVFAELAAACNWVGGTAAPAFASRAAPGKPEPTVRYVGPDPGEPAPAEVERATQSS